MQHGKIETVLFVAFVAAVVLWRTRKTFAQQGRERGQTSMMWSFYALFGVNVATFLGTIAEFFFVDRTVILAVMIVGMGLFAMSLWLRSLAVLTLGRYWSLHIEIRQDHPFVREGVYGYIRHPAYAAFVLEATAITLVGNAWWSLLAVWVVYVPLLLMRIHKEDEALIGKFGERYREYRGEVGTLIPRMSAWRRVCRMSRTNS
jgi:protein-S-isoprenylcysteine O-methyltransferase Ste14